MAARIVVRPGERFNRLTVIQETAPRVDPKGNRIRRVTVSCSCGKTFDADLYNIRSGNTKSCGCYMRHRIVETTLTHGMTGTATYRAWSDMISRCKYENRPAYKDYGGRGIEVCEEWMKFDRFFADMGEAPKNHQIDRIDNDGNYEKSNCRWVSKLENVRNTRISKYWFVHGVRYESISHAASSLNVSHATIQNWCNGMLYKESRGDPKPNCWSEPKYSNEDN